MCPFDKKEKYFSLDFYFQLQKNFVQETTYVQFFMYRVFKLDLSETKHLLSH